MTIAPPILQFDAMIRRGVFELAAAFGMTEGITALFGPSGSGKTTVLNLVAGLIRPQHGRIELGGDVLTDCERRVFVPPHQRRVGVVFQDAQLFPHLTVAQNIGFGRWFSGRREGELSAEAVTGVLGIGALMSRRPAGLSGGERQRVALARALLANPRLLLMDEPLASLDEARRQDILPLIEEVRDRFRIPILYVTHDAGEVERLASHVVMLEGGRVRDVGAPSQVLRSTRSVPRQGA